LKKTSDRPTLARAEGGFKGVPLKYNNSSMSSEKILFNKVVIIAVSSRELILGCIILII